jgi:predicted RNA-binding protein with PUA-like domain
MAKPPRRFWLFKSEPDVYGFAHFQKDGRTQWTGVRNYAARLHLKAMRPGDEVLYYHSNEGKAVVGIARVTKPAFADQTADEEGWVADELRAHAHVALLDKGDGLLERLGHL